MTTHLTPPLTSPPRLHDAPDGAPAASLTALTATRLLHQRVLLLDRELDQDNGAALAAQLLLLAAEDPAADITLLVSSPGGLVPAMLAIGDLMDLVPCDVRTVALGMAYSAGQYLLTQGTPGKRYLLPRSQVLMHQGSAGFGGSAADIALQAEDLRRNRDLLIRLTAERTGQSEETIARDSERDRIWDAEGAVDYGFADHVVTDIGQILPLAPTGPRGRTAGIGGAR